MLSTLLTTAACSFEADAPGVEERAEVGVLELPLGATAESGTRYALTGTFEVTALDRDFVTRLTTHDPDVEILSVELRTGRYSVELLDGWTLERVADGDRVAVAATLISSSRASATIDPNEQSRVLFRFRTPGEHFPANGGLEIGLAVEEAPYCCGDACPLRVDPAATEAGDGSSWESPMRDVQAAIDAQAAAGGGEVWVRGGGPFESLATTSDRTLLELRERVAVFGGFAGTELDREERDPEGRTLIIGSEDNAIVRAPLIVAASGATFDGFSVFGQSGATLDVQDVLDFRAANLTIAESSLDANSAIAIRDSSAELEAVTIRNVTGPIDPAGLLVERSDVRISGSTFSDILSISTAAMRVQSSRVVLEGVRFERDDGRASGPAGLFAGDSQILAVGTVWLHNRGDRGTVWLEGTRFVAVNSHWEQNGHIGHTVSLRDGGDGSFLNCSFVSNQGSAFGTLYAENSTLEVVDTSFFDNDVILDPNLPLPDDIGFEGPGQPVLFNSYSNREESILVPYTGTGNCLLPGSEPYLRSSSGLTEVFLRAEFGCVDTGDDNAALATARAAMTFAARLGATLPLEGRWWQALSSVDGLSSDEGPIDPGRHYDADVRP